MNRRTVAMGAFLAGLAVMMGAFGAHSLNQFVGDGEIHRALDNWRTAAHYHLIHSVALVVAGLAFGSLNSKWVRVSAWLFTIGILVFAGTLYAIALGAPRILGAVTPLGGLSLITGWICLGVAALGSKET